MWICMTLSYRATQLRFSCLACRKHSSSWEEFWGSSTAVSQSVLGGTLDNHTMGSQAGDQPMRWPGPDCRPEAQQTPVWLSQSRLGKWISRPPKLSNEQGGRVPC